MMDVKLVTKNATHDKLSVQDYRDIYTELRRLDMEPKDRISFDKFIAMIGSEYSKGQWAKYDAGVSIPDDTLRVMHSEMLKAIGQDPLPPTVAEATAAASPDAAVWMIGDGVPEHVIMVGATPVTLCVNGTVQVATPESHVTEVTRPPRNRIRYVRPCIPFEYAERLQGLVDVSWLDVIEAGLNSIEGYREYAYERIDDDGSTATQ